MSLNEVMIKRQVQSLERNLMGIFHLIKGKYDEFRELCRVFNPERGYSTTTVREIRDRYKEISAKFNDAKTLQQLLRSKYKGIAQVDPQKNREMEELFYMYKKDYRYFEQNQTEWEQKISRGGDVPQHLLAHIKAIYQKSSSLPSLILCFHGNSSLLKKIKIRIKMGSRDFCEEKEGKSWFFLAGIKPLDGSVLRSKLLETLFQGLNGGVKGVIFRVSGGMESKGEEVLKDMHQALVEVNDGDIIVL